MESIRKLNEMYGNETEVALAVALLRDEAVDAGLRKMFWDVYGVSTEDGNANAYVFSMLPAANDVWEFADALVNGAFYRRSKIPTMVSEGAFALAMMGSGIFDEAFCIYREWDEGRRRKEVE